VNVRALGITVMTLALASMAQFLVNRYRLLRMDMLAVLVVMASAA
jgi:hypothetical protein